MKLRGRGRRAGWLAGGVVAAAVVLGACSKPCPELPQPRPFSNQPLGGFCFTDADCEVSLRCLDGVGSDTKMKQCTRLCSEGCPAASHCLTAEENPSYGVCERDCMTDSDCVAGSTVGPCVRHGIDGGYSFCQTSCSSFNDTCPAGSRCVGEICTQYDNGYAIGSGWCERTP